MKKIHTFFGFKNGELISVTQSVDPDIKKALDCSYYITQPQDVEKQLKIWKQEKLK